MLVWEMFCLNEGRVDGMIEVCAGAWQGHGELLAASTLCTVFEGQGMSLTCGAVRLMRGSFTSVG